MFKIGIGYDVHRLVEDRPLIIGGVHIPYKKGLLGHSDADVLIHVLMDAILGALGKGDIGTHFPDHDEQYRGISSRKLLREVHQMVESEGYTYGNIDLIVIAQRPKIMPYVAEMKACLSQDLGIEPSAINIKGTTTEGLGFEGKGEGIAAQGAVLLLKRTVASQKPSMEGIYRQ